MLYINIHCSVVKKNSRSLNTDFIGIQWKILVLTTGINFKCPGSKFLCLESLNTNSFSNGFHGFLNILNLGPPSDTKKMIKGKFNGTTRILCTVDIKTSRKNLHFCVRCFKGSTKIVHKLFFKSLDVASLECKLPYFSKIGFCINRKIDFFFVSVFLVSHF